MLKLKSLLIVDDENDLAEIIAEIAGEHFEIIHICNQAIDAIEYLERNEVSVILSDVSMPKMSGEVFLKKLRAGGNNTPIVFLTGNASKELAISALKLGASDFIEKPFEPVSLIETLKLVVEIEDHKRKLRDLESQPNINVELVQNEKKALAIKQSVRAMPRRA